MLFFRTFLFVKLLAHSEEFYVLSVAKSILITVYLTVVVIDLFSKIVPDALNPNKYLPFKIPGLEILIALIITTFIGMISLTYFGKQFLLLGKNLLERIPIVRSIYSGVTQFTKSFQEEGSSSKKVVLIEFLKPGAWAVGFATNETTKPISPKISDNFKIMFYELNIDYLKYFYNNYYIIK